MYAGGVALAGVQDTFRRETAGEGIDGCTE